MNTQVLLIPHMRVQNANAMSSPYTIGIPALTAWMGAVHAMQRALNADDLPVKFLGVGIVSHQFNLQVYKGPGDFVYSIVGTGNPLEPKTEKDKPKGNAARPSFIEEARCHLEASLAVEFNGLEAHQEEILVEKMAKHLDSGIKLAGGDILSFGLPAIVSNFNLLRQKLMPGYALIERRELVCEAMENGEDALDAVLDYLALHHRSEPTSEEQTENAEWHSFRKPTKPEGGAGWIVPIATGFHGISDLGNALNQRDPEFPHRFAESLVTLGEFVMPYRLNFPEQLFWYYTVYPEKNLYLCEQFQQTDHDDF